MQWAPLWASLLAAPAAAFAPEAASARSQIQSHHSAASAASRLPAALPLASGSRTSVPPAAFQSRRRLIAGLGGLTALGATAAAAYSPPTCGDDTDAPAPFNEGFDWGDPTPALQLVDGAVHLWSDGQAPYPWAEGHHPDPEYAETATVEKLLALMDEAQVAGAVAVQPLCHKFDHSYLAACLAAHPTRFKGVCLANPTLPVDEAVAELVHLKKQGFSGVRFNPALWPDGSGGMDSATGRALYAKAGELGMPVSFLLMDGFAAEAQKVEALLASSPATVAVLDHYGFAKCSSRAAPYSMTGELEPEHEWLALLALCEQYPENLFVKASAQFRVSQFGYPYTDVRTRTAELLSAIGPSRVLFGSDFPFGPAEVTSGRDEGMNDPNEAGAGDADPSVPPMLYTASSHLPFTWSLDLKPPALHELTRGTAEALYGKLG